MQRPADTSLDAHQRQMDAYRSMTPSERLRLAASMSDEVSRLAAAGAERRLATDEADSSDVDSLDSVT